MALGKIILENQFGEVSENVIVGDGGVASLFMSMPGGANMYAGAGVPAVSAPKGSIYFRADGTTMDEYMYVNTALGSNWTAAKLAS